MNIDIERLRRDLIDYFGAAAQVFHIAVMDVINVENASYDKLIEIAKCNNFNLDNYIIEPYIKNLIK